MTKPVLVIPNLDKEIKVETNTSDFAMKEVLQMKCKDEKQKQVVYILKLLNKAKRNYGIHNKEMLAIIRCLEAQRYFQFEIQTNYKNLKYFMKAQKLNQRQCYN